jgi:CAAX prenyl protease-like protein
VGALVFLVWIIAAHFLLPQSAMPEKLATVPAALRGFWIASRIAGSILIVPIAEELAYRGYLMRRLTESDFESVPFHSVRWPALAVTAIVFGLAHGALWLPGIAAGIRPAARAPRPHRRSGRGSRHDQRADCRERARVESVAALVSLGVRAI